MTDFVPGLTLCRQFFHTIVHPIVAATTPDLAYSAALLGSGSEVLGFDTAMSTDHDWGPRVMLFVHEEAYDEVHAPLAHALQTQLPREFGGYPLFIAPAQQLPEAEAVGEEGLYHRVELWTLRHFFRTYLNFEIATTIEAADWLTFPQQKLRAITAGAIFHDEIGLQAVRDQFDWYPHDVWLYLLAAGWNRISQEEHLMGRAGLVGDEIGSTLIANRLVRDLMNLCFLMEKQYAPYPKWFGVAFAQLACARDVSPLLRAVQTALTWQEREEHLVAAYQVAARMHNALGITPSLPTTVEPFFTRPFQVIWGGRFAEALAAQIGDGSLKWLAQNRLLGSIDQFSDSTDLLSDPRWRSVLRELYA